VTSATDTTAAAARSSTVAAVARAWEPDRYLAALLAPPAEREALLALAAFSAELVRIPFAAAREPAMGSVRLQWWHDALALPAHLQAGHEVADAVRIAVRTQDLPLTLLADAIDARAVLLDAGPLPSRDALLEFLWRAEGSQFALAAHILGAPIRGDAAGACRAAGEAYGLARLLMGLPRSLSLGRIPLPQEEIAAAGLSPEDLRARTEAGKVERLLGRCFEQIDDSLDLARRLARELPRATRVAFLPLALVGTYLRAVKRTAPSALRAEAGVAPLARVLRIAAAHWLGRP
jgi:phytoene synthase